ncbi:transcription elongation factor GreA [Sphaerochaeta sp. PS]|uniref:transcription elongation factor GreA n=1 Tax=Sphaerochaeta sp. PS TaxID=3076336 RepID=UPI0028A3A11E|nr:transcription elongation factor GreA [Sphaerochaeta sp. PS]MDT4761471.1 transcription elongation factor GreA [Sphaerochaeta sp. PS]
MGFQEIESLLKEEQWTRSTIVNYTIQSLEGLDVQISELDEEEKTEAKILCDNHLTEKERNSIIAMYISGSIQLERRGSEDYLLLLNLIELFAESKKWTLVEFLCQKILRKTENKHALRLLANSYAQNNREDEKYAIWERLVKVDYDEIEIVKLIGTYAQQKGNKEKAVAMYKKAIHRLIKRKDSSPIRSIFNTLLELDDDNFEYYMNLADQVGTLSKNTAVALLRDLEIANKDNVDHQIEAQKKILSLDREDIYAKENLIKSYKAKYKNHSRLKNCLESSALTSNMVRDVIHSIEDFETNIAFDKGTFVFQNSTGKIGRIRSINENDVIVDFAGQKNTEGNRLSTAMAFKSLLPLAKSHIWVLKSALPKEKLSAKVLEDIPWTLKTLLTSNGGKSSLKEMKAELVPSVLEPKQWTSWSNHAKKELMNNPVFDLSANDVDTYILRSTPVSYEEKQLAVFRSEKQFYDKIKRLKEFLSSKGDVESDFFYEMVKYFSDMFLEENGSLKQMGEVTDYTFSAFLLLEDLVLKQNMNFINRAEGLTFKDLFERTENYELSFDAIKDPELKKSFIDHVVEEVQNWSKVLANLFQYYLTSYIPDIFRHHKKQAEFNKVYRDAVENFKEKSSTLIYLIKNSDEKLWNKAGITSEQLLFTKLQLLDFTNRCIDTRKDVQENRKNAKTLMTLLFTDKAVLNHINEGNEESAQKIYSLVANVFDLPGGKKIEIKHAISEKFPSFRFFDEVSPIDRESLVPTGLFCTAAALDAKKKEMEHIQHVELVEVAKEIGLARDMGDLRENSEYKYGKEKQSMLSNTLRRLSEEIDRATVITKDKVDPTRIGFGTKVVLFDNLKGEEITYTIMGPWESNPNENIINLLAPFGKALLNHQEGERFIFTLNDQDYDYTVRKISVIEL